MKVVVGILTAMALPVYVHAGTPITPLPNFSLPSTNQSLPNFTSSNYPVAGFTPTNRPAITSTPRNEICPLIEMFDIPIMAAVEHLARQAGINYLIAPALAQKWTDSGEPIVSFRLKNVVPKDVLIRMLDLHHVALIEDPASNIAFIVPANQVADPLFGGSSKTASNAFSSATNIIPLIQFEIVPITTAIENLARQAEICYMIDPEVSRQWSGYSAAGFVPEPVLSLRFENVTCWNTLNRILNIRGLAVIEDVYTHVARITVSNKPLPVVDTSLLEAKSNNSNEHTNDIIPLIQFTDVPLDVMLVNLIRQSGAHIELAPELKDKNYWQDNPPQLSIRWTDKTANQAIVALCKNYDLVIAMDDITGGIQIKPKEVVRHHHLQLR